MEIMTNATLGGAVAVGSSADLIASPGVALGVGFLGGMLTAIGFATIAPWLLERIGLHDSCAIHSLHGIPGVLGALLSMGVITTMKDNGFPDEYLAITRAGGTYND